MVNHWGFEDRSLVGLISRIGWFNSNTPDCLMGDASTLPESYLVAVTGWQLNRACPMEWLEPSLRMGNHSTPHTYLKGGLLSPSGSYKPGGRGARPSQNDTLCFVVDTGTAPGIYHRW